GACVDGRPPGRSDGAAPRTRVAEPDGPCGPDRHGDLSADGDAERRAAHRLGEAGAGQPEATASAAARLRARRRRRSREQPADGDRRRDRAARRAGVAGHAGRAERHGAARRAAQPGDAAERAARRLQHDPDSAARRRQRAERRPAGARGVPVQRGAAAVRLPHPLRADVHARIRIPRASAVALSVVLAAVTITRPRVVSGMRPTGRLHLGHLVGALRNWVQLQEAYDCFYFVADWHALTSDYADTSQVTAYA